MCLHRHKTSCVCTLNAPKSTSPALSQAVPPSATPNWALLINTNKQSLNFATCDDPDPKKPQAKGLVPNLQYKIQMETLDTLSGHTDGGQSGAHNLRGSVGLESRTQPHEGWKSWPPVRTSAGEQRRKGTQQRQERGGTYCYLHAVRAVKPGEQSPKEHFQGVQWPRMLPRMELVKHQHSTFHTPEGMIPTIPFCTWAASRSTARHSRYGMGDQGLVVNEVVLGLWLDSTILEVFSNWKVHFTTKNSTFPNPQAGTCTKVQSVISVHRDVSFNQVLSIPVSTPQQT